VATAAARRYAKAVFELARDEGSVAEWAHRLHRVSELLADAEVAAVLTNPTIPVTQREALIAAAPHQFDDETTNLARLLIESLERDDRDRVERELSRRLNKEVSLDVVVDPRVIGGLRLQYGDRVVDATVATRLQQLRRRLAAT